MISSNARCLTFAVKQKLLEEIVELRRCVVAEDGEDVRPLDDFIRALKGSSAVSPRHHFFHHRLRQAVFDTDAEAILRLIAELEQEKSSAVAIQAKQQDKYEFAKLALSELSQSIGINFVFDTQWHSANEHLLDATRELIENTYEDLAHAVRELLPEIYVFNNSGSAAFDFSAMTSIRFNGVLFVNRGDITAPETLADILVHQAGIAFASGWLATDPHLLGDANGVKGGARCNPRSADAASLLLSASGCAWHAMWAHNRSLSDSTPAHTRTLYENISALSTQQYVFRMRALAREYDLGTQLAQIAILTENMMANSGVTTSAHLEEM